MRGAALIVVVAWHAFLTVVPEDPTPAQHVVILVLGPAARLALLSFILLSGYLLGRHWDGDLRRFLLRRCWRILPPYWVALTVTILAMLLLGLRHPGGTHWDTGLPLTLSRSVIDYLLLSDIAGQIPLSHPLWTVPVEFHLYLLAPLIVLLRRQTVVLATGLGVAVLLTLLAPGFIAPHFVLAFMAAFWLGRHRQTAPPRVLPLVVPIALAFLVLAAVALTSDLSTSALRYLLVDSAAATPFLAWLIAEDLRSRAALQPLRSALAGNPLRWLGVRSYSIYLVHAVALELLWRAGVDDLAVSETTAILLMCAAGLVVSVAAGTALFRAVELPTTIRAAAVRRRIPRPAEEGV